MLAQTQSLSRLVAGAYIDEAGLRAGDCDVSFHDKSWLLISRWIDQLR
jgi:hypothetical protein